MRRPKTMAILFDEGTQIFAVKYAQLSTPPRQDDLFMCGHCPSAKAKPEMDIVQYGFLDDLHRLVCFCPECLQLTVYEYKIGDNDA